MDIFANTIPVTAGSPPGGRPRKDDPPENAFARWLSSQPRTIKEIAADLSLTRWTVYHLRDGYHHPSLDVANRIAEMSRSFDPKTGKVGEPAVPTDSWPRPRPRTPQKHKPKTKSNPVARRRRG